MISTTLLLGPVLGSTLALAAAGASPSTPDEIPTYHVTHEGDVWRSGDDAHTYRIPAVVRVGEGEHLVAFCEARRGGRSDAGDIDLVARHSQDGGRTWSEPSLVWDDGPNTCGNPCPVYDPATGTLILLATHNLGKDKEAQIIAGTSVGTRTVWVLRSTDAGRTWSAPEEITATAKRPDWTWYATGPGQGIVLERGTHAGRIVIPCDHIEKDSKRYFSHVLLSDDHGATFRLGGSSPRDQVNECEVLERADGSLLLDMRNYDRSKHARQTCVSTDGGLSFEDQRHDETRIEPICQASLRRISWPTKDGTPGVVAFSNPASAERRERMTLRLSQDDGATWPSALVLHEGPSAYSCLVALPDGAIGCLYEADDYGRIVFARVEPGEPGAHESSRPNLVLILSDDQGFTDYGFMGHPVIRTPRLDQLAEESLVFSRGYVTTALCCPSLSTLLTGRFPHQHGFTGNDPVAGRDRKDWIEPFAKLPQLPALLSAAGYRCLHTGKYWQGDPKRSGFTDDMGETGRHGGQALAIGRETMAPIESFVADAQEKGQPFFLWYAPFLPHQPHDPPERLLAKYRDSAKDLPQAKYFAMCEWLDETCGVLLDLLDARGLRDNTLVFFLSDNGWSQGTDGFRGSKQTLWEQGVRQPFLLRWPGHVAPRRDDEHLVSNLDFAPTLLAAAGLPVPESMAGVDLRDAAALDARPAIFLEDFTHDMAAPDHPERTLEGRAVIAGNWKLIVTNRDKRAAMDPQTAGTFLFDLRHDPQEQHDLAAAEPARVAELRKLLDAWWNPADTEH